MPLDVMSAGLTPDEARKALDLEKVFLRAGFRFARQEGSHRSYVKPGIPRPIVIPIYDKEEIAWLSQCVRERI
jgi:predicted RNA binding protein YcfA (HicA-like mRNA interferase family)